MEIMCINKNLLKANFRKKIDLRVTKDIISKYLLVNYENIFSKTTEQILKNVTFTRDFSSTIFEFPLRFTNNDDRASCMPCLIET